jgi:hypothetical protein
LQAEFGIQHVAALEARLDDQGQRHLDEPVDATQIPPWKVVAPSIPSQLRELFQSYRQDWIVAAQHDNLEPGFVPAGKNLTMTDALVLQAIVLAYRTRLEALANLSFDLAVEADERIWDEGRFAVSLFVELVPEAKTSADSELLYIRKCVHGPWIVTVVLDSSEWESLNQVLQHAAELRQERRQRITDYINSI